MVRRWSDCWGPGPCVCVSLEERVSRENSLYGVCAVCVQAGEEPVDVMPAIRQACEPKCQQYTDKYRACLERVAAKGVGECDGQYFDFLHCIDKCVRAALVLSTCTMRRADVLHVASVAVSVVGAPDHEALEVDLRAPPSLIYFRPSPGQSRVSCVELIRNRTRARRF